MHIVVYLIHEFIKREKKSIFIIFVLSLIISLLEVNVISFITAEIINALQTKIIKSVYKYFVFLVIVSMCYVGLGYIYNKMQYLLINKMKLMIKHDLVKIILKVYNARSMESSPIHFNSPINRISENCHIFINSIIAYAFPSIALLIVIAGYFLVKNVNFGLLFITTIIIISLYLNYKFKYLAIKNKEYEHAIMEHENSQIEILGNVDKIVHTGQTSVELNKFLDKTKSTIRSANKINNETNMIGINANLILHTCIFITAFYLIRMQITNNINITTFITFFTIILIFKERFMWSIQDLPYFLEFIGRSNNVADTMESIPEQYIKSMGMKYVDYDLPFQKVVFRNVGFKYVSSKTNILENYNTELEFKNNIIGIVGPSGKGKSTIAKLMIKSFEYTGDILFDNVDLRTIDSDYIHKNVVYVSQTSILFNRNVSDNLLYGCNDIEKCKMQLQYIEPFPKLKKMITDMLAHNKMVGHLGEKVSGGQRQIINIINGMIGDAKIVILDEPTNALDPELKKELIQYIKSYKSRKNAIIIITHDKDVIPIMDKIITP